MDAIPAPRFENSGPIHAIGLRARYRRGQETAIAGQWQALAALMPRLPASPRKIAYGVCCDRPDGLDYLAGIDVAGDAPAGVDGTSRIDLPAQRYAVFAHDGDVTALPRTCAAIFRGWAPRSGCELVREKDGTLVFFERYGPGFDPAAGRGDIEVWIPVK